MRVFKTTYKDRKGKTRESSKWYVEFRDQREKIRRLPGYTGHVHELRATGVRSAIGLPLLHNVAYYTLNYLPNP